VWQQNERQLKPGLLKKMDRGEGKEQTRAGVDVKQQEKQVEVEESRLLIYASQGKGRI